MAPSAGVWAPIAQRVLRQAVGSTARLSKELRSRLNAHAGAAAKSTLGARQPIHPAAFLRQSARGTKRYIATARGFHTTLRRFISTATEQAPRFDRSAIIKSNVASRAVWQSTGRTPFASTVRPNLTGGAMPRTAGGYSMSGQAGARYFSHSPASSAQVVQNVSQAMRAFWLSGQRAHFDGMGANGERKYRAVSTLQEETGRKMASVPQHIPGSYIDFKLSPTITALSPLAGAFASDKVNGLAAQTQATLGAEGFLDVLSVDFARALKDLAAVMNDLKKLGQLGDLSISLVDSNVLRVRFPGVDGDTVDRLCDDLGVMRGVVHEEAEFSVSAGVPVALRFPFAPGFDDKMSISSPGGSLRSHRSEASSADEEEACFVDDFVDGNPWLSSDEEGYESMSPPVGSSKEQYSEDFEGLEGIYRFLEECDRAKGRF